MYRRDVLQWALTRCRINDDAPRADGQAFADIESYGVGRWLNELAEELRTGTYRPRAARRVPIPKLDGKQRPLGIPCIKNRVVQMAAVLVLESIFEADLEPEQLPAAWSATPFTPLARSDGCSGRGKPTWWTPT